MFQYKLILFVSNFILETGSQTCTFILPFAQENCRKTRKRVDYKLGSDL